MQSLWNESEAQALGGDPLALRVYTSRLLGGDPALVLHGGGNTSVKASATNLFGETEELLYVKGSGWDLATIEAAGFAPVRISVLHQLAELPAISDSELVRMQRAAMIDPSAPAPSIEAVLHAIIPHVFVDHTHSDAVVALTNTPHGETLVREVYGENVLIVPYVMPGFILARAVYEMTHGLNWASLDGIILMNHGVFSFGATAKEAYEGMIRLVTQAEDALASRGAFGSVAASPSDSEDLLALSRIRRMVSDAAGQPMIARINQSAESFGFASLPNVGDIATRGTLTPDHIIRTKRIPLVVGNEIDASMDEYAANYRAYFERHNDGTLTMLDPAPRWAVWPGFGTITFGATIKAADIVADIVGHTIPAIQWAEHLGGWRALPENDLFEVEYWELEQAKLRKGGGKPSLQGKVAVVTGAASGIGKACATELAAQGASVLALDLNAQCEEMFNTPSLVGRHCDVTRPENVRKAIEEAVRRFGGIDILVSNAGIFPGSQRIEAMDADAWDRTLSVNLTSHQRMIQACIPFLKNGIDPTVIVIGSKNVPAPGPGQAAYSVSKAGVTQLARVAALELGSLGIRVNVLHPNMVFDTGVWTPEVIESRAHNYGISVEEYKSNNLLKAVITSEDVAKMVAVVAGPVFLKTTGAQIPIDGGNDRVV